MSRTTAYRILVIDDNPAIHEDFRKILTLEVTASAKVEKAVADIFNEPIPQVETSVFEVDCAFQGSEGLACVREACAAGRPYAVAFVDVRMPPGWDGIETIKN